MAADGLLRRNPQPSEKEIREYLGANICRCTGYVRYLEATRDVILATPGLTIGDGRAEGS